MRAPRKSCTSGMIVCFASRINVGMCPRSLVFVRVQFRPHSSAGPVPQLARRQDRAARPAARTPQCIEREPSLPARLDPAAHRHAPAIAGCATPRMRRRHHRGSPGFGAGRLGTIKIFQHAGDITKDTQAIAFFAAHRQSRVQERALAWPCDFAAAVSLAIRLTSAKCRYNSGK